jgi:hypothetical protein
MSEVLEDWKTAYQKDFESLLLEIMETNSDYIVPVGRKCGKLFRTVKTLPRDFHKKVFYRDYFEFLEPPLKGKTVAIVDDSVRHGSALREYREFFDNRGAKVLTFAFIGHMGLRDRTSICYDPKIQAKLWLSEPSYTDYLFTQAEHLLLEGFYQDVDHLVLEIDLGPSTETIQESLFGLLEKEGYAYFVRPYLDGVKRFSVFEPAFFLAMSKLHPQSGFFAGINKLRFHSTEYGQLIFVPMVLPKLDSTNPCRMHEWKTPFQVPCQSIRKKEHRLDKLCYWSSSLLLSAELGRSFLQFLKIRGLTELLNACDNLKVRDIDFVRYLGSELGKKLADDISHFLKEETYNPNEGLLARLNRTLFAQNQRPRSGSFSGRSISEVTSHLRDGYEERVRMAGTRLGVHYSLNFDQIVNMTGIQPLLLMELLDSYCDVGILVPVVDDDIEPIERRWRSGEPPANYAWKRTTFLLPISIKAAADELKSPGNRVGSVSLMKILANFTYDYHEKCQPLRHLHCFKRRPSWFGPTVTAQDPFMAPNPIEIYNSEELGNLYKYEQTGIHEGYFSTSDDVLTDKELTQFFDNTGSISLDQIVAYFTLLANIQSRFGSTDVLTALSVCRNRDMFLLHVNWNLNLWLNNFRIFLDSLITFPYSEDKDNGPLHLSARAANAGLEKISLWQQFPSIIQKLQNDIKEIRFKRPLSRILQTIEPPVERQLPILGTLERLFSTQRALSGCVIATLMPHLASREPEEIMLWAKEEFKKHSFNFDTDLLKEDSLTTTKDLLQKAYHEMYQETQSLPVPLDEESELEAKAYRRSAINQGVAVVRERGWEHPALVQLDLTGFRGAGESAEDYVQQLYKVADLNGSHFGGECITKEPGGNDCLLYVFFNIMPALRMASHCQAHYTKENIPVKFGAERTIVAPGHEYESVIAAMGRAKDLCEYKNEPHYRNTKDILVSSELVNYLNDSGLLPRDYFMLVEKAALEKKGLRGTEIGVFRLLWEKFLSDKR